MEFESMHSDDFNTIHFAQKDDRVEIPTYNINCLRLVRSDNVPVAAHTWLHCIRTGWNLVVLRSNLWAAQHVLSNQLQRLFVYQSTVSTAFLFTKIIKNTNFRK